MCVSVRCMQVCKATARCPTTKCQVPHNFIACEMRLQHASRNILQQIQRDCRAITWEILKRMTDDDAVDVVKLSATSAQIGQNIIIFLCDKTFGIFTARLVRQYAYACIALTYIGESRNVEHHKLNVAAKRRAKRNAPTSIWGNCRHSSSIIKTTNM